MTSKKLRAPAGMTGLSVEPWARGEIYAVAADWSQASSLVLSWGDDEWVGTGRQVADHRHEARAALAAEIRAALEASGDEVDEDEVESIISDAAELRSIELAEMCDMLDGHGDTYSGNHVEDTAQDWLDHDFTDSTADAWCSIGVWDAATAAAFRDAGKTPEQIQAACERLIEEAGDEAAERYTDGDPIYAACNSDLNSQVLIDACE